MPTETVVRYRTIDDDEHDAAIKALCLGFSIPDRHERYRRLIRPERVRVVEAGGELATVLYYGRLGQWWHGRSLPSAQVLGLATPPQHRGRGYGTELLRGLLGELHADGVPTMTLYASTARLYRGAGLEYAGGWTRYEARAEHLPRTTAPYQARQVPLDDIGEIRALYRRVAPGRHGALDRDETWWQNTFLRERDGHTPLAFVLDGPDGPAGWLIATFDQDPSWSARIDVRDWGCLPGAQPALLGFLGGYGALDARVTWTGPDLDPALLALPDHSFRIARRDPWMLRIVDLPAAFTARPYPAGVAGRAGFTVTDRLCPWNSGSWLLEVADGKATLERGPAGPASADVRGLAALFTGYQEPADLAAAGLLGGFDDDTLAFLHAAFTTRRPWTAEHY